MDQKRPRKPVDPFRETPRYKPEPVEEFYTKVFRKCPECNGYMFITDEKGIHSCPTCEGTGEQEFKMTTGIPATDSNVNCNHYHSNKPMRITKP